LVAGALFVCCLAVPARLNAQTAAEYVNRANALLEGGECDKAITACNQAIAAANPEDSKDNPTIVDAYCVRGEAWFLNRKDDKAIADYS